MPDQETIKGQHTLLETYRKRLRVQIDQQKKLGTFAPAYIQIEIDEAQEQIKQIKKYLRANGQVVEDLPEDGGISILAPVIAAAPQTPPPTTAGPSQAATDGGHTQAAEGNAESGPADVFISYHPADKEWVRKQLLPLLEQQYDLRAIIDYRDFEIGVPKVTNIENAVAGSRHTLIVLTPDWVASEWNSFHGLLAGSADPSGLRAKLMPIIYKPTELPDRIKMLEPSDLTDPDEREIQLQRLIRSIKRSRP